MARLGRFKPACRRDTGEIRSITTSNGPIVVSVATFKADQSTLDKIKGGFDVADAAANLVKHLSILNADSGVHAITADIGHATLSGGVGVNAPNFSETGWATSFTLDENLNYAGSFSEDAGSTFVLSGGHLLLSGTATFAGGNRRRLEYPLYRGEDDGLRPDDRRNRGMGKHQVCDPACEVNSLAGRDLRVELKRGSARDGVRSRSEYTSVEIERSGGDFDRSVFGYVGDDRARARPAGLLEQAGVLDMRGRRAAAADPAVGRRCRKFPTTRC
jgi:hypothetical protein